MRYLFITINYNNTEDSVELVNSFINSEYANDVELIIVDNKSETENYQDLEQKLKNLEIDLHVKCDHFLEKRETNEKLNVILYPNTINSGFAGGNNIILKEIINSSDDFFVCLINNDVIFNAGFIKEITNFSSDNKDSIISPLIYFAEPKDHIWFNGGNFNSVLFRIKIFDYMQTSYSHHKHINFISGCCMLMHSSILEKVGLLREDFFMYEEDLEYCLRAKNKNVPFKICNSTSILHKVGMSAGNNENNGLSDFALIWMTKNRFKLIFEYKTIFSSVLPVLFNMLKSLKEANNPKFSFKRMKLVLQAIIQNS